MACNTITGLPKSCDPNVKGIRNLYIADHEDVEDLTVVSGNVTVIDMVASPTSLFQKFDFRKNTGSMYDETMEDNTQGLDGYIQTITLILNRREVLTRNAIQTLAEGFRDLDIIIEDANGLFWYFGASFGVNLTAVTGTSEVANYTLTFTGNEPLQAYTVDASAVAAVIA